MSTLDRIRHHDNRLKGPVLYTRSHLNRGFKQVVGLLDSLQEGRFNQINVLPLLAFRHLDTIHKNKCPHKRFGYTEDCLERSFVKQRLNFVYITGLKCLIPGLPRFYTFACTYLYTLL